MTEYKIKESYHNWLNQGNGDYCFEYAEDAFKAGYLACLNSLRFTTPDLYRLPEGVSRDTD